MFLLTYFSELVIGICALGIVIGIGMLVNRAKALHDEMPR